MHDYVTLQAQERRLCAYTRPRSVSAVSVNDLRHGLATRVGRTRCRRPYILMDRLPLTKDLKVDRRRLPKPGRERPAAQRICAATNTGGRTNRPSVVRGARNRPVGVTDSLLALGGDSLRAARIVNRLRLTYGDRIRITSVFEHPTVRALSRALEPGRPRRKLETAVQSHTRRATTASRSSAWLAFSGGRLHRRVLAKSEPDSREHRVLPVQRCRSAPAASRPAPSSRGGCLRTWIGSTPRCSG